MTEIEGMSGGAMQLGGLIWGTLAVVLMGVVGWKVVEVVILNHKLARLPQQGLRWYMGGVMWEIIVLLLWRGKGKDLMGRTVEYQAALGEIYVGFVGWIGFVTINGGQLIREVSVKSDGVNFKKNFGYELAQPLLGSSLLLSNGSFWHSQRKKMEGGFAYKHIRRVMVIVQRLCNERMERWERQGGEGGRIEINGYAEMVEMTADTIGLFTFSQKFNGKLAEAFNDVLEAIFWFIWMEGFSPYLKHIPTPFVLRYRRSLRYLRQTIRSLIADRRLSSPPPADQSPDHSLLYDGGSDQVDEDEDEEDDMIGVLLKGKEQMSEELLEDELLGLIFAGHDTTASTLTWALVMLAQHPSSQLLLLDDISSFPLHPPFNIAQLEKLKYLDLLVKEVLRLYPPAIIGRTALKDITLTHGQRPYTIPKGAEIFINLFAMHRNPEVWGADANLFKPERMADLQSDPIRATNYLPFGEVPRNCIGRRFALLEIKLALILIVSRFHISLNPSKPHPSLYPSLTLHPNNVFLILYPRS